MEAVANSTRPSRLSVILVAVVRTLFIAVVFAALGMALGLFAGIMIQVFRSLSGGVDMTLAYRHVAFPTAITFGIVALCAEAVVEARRHRHKAHRTP